MILKARHHPIIFPFFKFYTKWLIRKNFSKVEMVGKYINTGLPILLISNHSGWWDGFWALYLNMKVFGRKFHFMMLEEQLRKYWYFNYCGGFSVKKKSKSIVETMHYTREILTDKQNLVLLFPQGEIESMHKQTFSFEKGVEKLLTAENTQIQIIFLACLTDYLSSKNPGLYLYFGDYQDPGKSLSALEDAYNRFYKQCVEQQSALKV